MNTTDKSRADALTAQQRQAIDLARSFMPNNTQAREEAHTVLEALAASSVEQPAAAPTHKPSCASLTMLLLTSPPKPARCDCGAIASPVEPPAAAPISSDREFRVAAAQLVRDMMADLSRTIEALESRSPSIAKNAMTIPDPTDDVLCACGWETWNSLGSYVDRGTATARYRTIAAFVLEGISSPQPLAQPDASQPRGAQ
ncbi:hypothetical protein [Burkholderia cepacia]|uniref:hypothetical protein n=1 Tax=Burkholderia cepacia TaxID=292 RepID=UPI0012D8F69E|nr:hypothetical protein [Burkholderia cepacia]